MILIDIKALKPGIHAYDWDVEAEALGLDPDVFRGLRVAAQLDYQSAQIFVKIHTFATARLTCDRTLVLFDQSIVGKHSVLFSSEAMVEGQEEPGDDVRIIDSSDEEIDLTDLVRDTFILSVPHRKIAPGAEAEDIQVEFGGAEKGASKIDPRWEVLRKLSSLDDSSSADE